MQDIQYINSSSLAPSVGHYSHAVCANGLIFLSGQLPISADGHKAQSFDEQAQQIFENLDNVLSKCNSNKTCLIQVRVYIKDIEQWPKFNQLYAEWIGDYRPARCVVPVPTLHFDSELEIEAIAQQIV